MAIQWEILSVYVYELLPAELQSELVSNELMDVHWSQQNTGQWLAHISLIYMELA